MFDPTRFSFPFILSLSYHPPIPNLLLLPSEGGVGILPGTAVQTVA